MTPRQHLNKLIDASQKLIGRLDACIDSVNANKDPGKAIFEFELLIDEIVISITNEDSNTNTSEC